jgi:phosphatidate phosphatase APP1
MTHSADPRPGPARRARDARGLFAVVAVGLAVALAAAAARAGDPDEIAVHYAYGTPRQFTLEGRVIERRDLRPARGGDSWLRNLWRAVRSLRAEERKGVEVTLSFAGRRWTVRTDDEGYFASGGDTPPEARPGWNPLLAQTGGGARAETGLLVVPDENALGIVSDLDDTVIVSEVPDRSRLARHTLLENYLQRRPVAGMAALYRAILARNPVPAAAPAFYVTASPRQLQPAIEAFLDRNGFPHGPVVAKKVTDGAGADPIFDQQRYKTERIERILADLPGVRFVLVGDDGERDPEVYDAIRSRHPGRVEAVYIRQVGAPTGRPAYPGQVPPPVDGR